MRSKRLFLGVISILVASCSSPRNEQSYVILMGSTPTAAIGQPPTAPTELPQATRTPVPTTRPTDTPPIVSRPEPLRLYDYDSIVEWTVYAIFAEPAAFADLVRPMGASYVPYQEDEVFFPTDEGLGYDNGGVISMGLEEILRNASPECLGYNWEVMLYPGQSEGNARWGQLRVVFDGIDISSVGLETDTEMVEFVYILEDFPGRSGLVAIRTVPSWAATSATEDLHACPQGN